MIHALIFDCFGVLTTDGWLAFKSKYFTEGSAELAEATELNHQTDAGIITQEEFVSGIARLAGVSRQEADMVTGSHVRNEELFVYIRDVLKPSYKIGMLSNASADWTRELFEPWQVELFDEKVFSFELGVTKPHPAMYQTIATKLGMLPEECLFIDDREGFVAGAKEVGMEAVQFKNTPQCKRDIEVILEEHRA